MAKLLIIRTTWHTPENRVSDVIMRVALTVIDGVLHSYCVLLFGVT